MFKTGCEGKVSVLQYYKGTMLDTVFTQRQSNELHVSFLGKLIKSQYN